MKSVAKGLGVWGLVAGLLVGAAMPVCAAPAVATGQNNSAVAPSKAVRVLFIGNSYTYYNGGLGAIVQSMAAKAGQRMEFVEVTKGGQTLEGHWNDGKALAAIKKGGWDFVVLQENSMRPLLAPEKMVQYATMFDAEIRKVGAKTVFYETWARKNKPEMQAEVCKAYEGLARQLKATVAPAGRAWEAALKAHPELVLHIKDMSHPTPMASYLNGCVMYATLFDKTPDGLTRAIKSVAGKALFEVPEAEATVLQKAAGEILATWKKATDTTSGAALPASGTVAPSPAAVAAEKRS